jgi:hypothetical protein
VTAGRASRNLRTGSLCWARFPWSRWVSPTKWLTFTGTPLTAGHTDGAISFSVGAEAGPVVPDSVPHVSEPKRAPDIQRVWSWPKAETG